MNANFPSSPSNPEVKSSEELNLVPVERDIVQIAENPHQTPNAWVRGQKQYNTNNGIVQFNSGEDLGRSEVALNDGDMIASLEDQGYTNNPNATVIGGNGLTSHEADEVFPRLALDRAARSSGAMRRETTFTDASGNEQPTITDNPFNDGEYVTLGSNTQEVLATGEYIDHPSLLRNKINNPDFLANVGKFNTNNGVLSWTTVGGEVQITPVSDERVEGLEAMGYTINPDMNVPHSHGEAWNTEYQLSQVVNKSTGENMGTTPELWESLQSGELARV